MISLGGVQIPKNMAKEIKRKFPVGVTRETVLHYLLLEVGKMKKRIKELEKEAWPKQEIIITPNINPSILEAAFAADRREAQND